MPEREDLFDFSQRMSVMLVAWQRGFGPSCLAVINCLASFRLRFWEESVTAHSATWESKNSNITYKSIHYLHSHLCWTFLDCKHYRRPQEGTAATRLPKGAREEQPRWKAAADLWPLFYREPADALHHSVVRQLHWSGQERVSESYLRSTEDHQLPSRLHEGHLWPALPQQGKNYCEGLPTPRFPPVGPVALWQALYLRQNMDKQI